MGYERREEGGEGDLKGGMNGKLAMNARQMRGLNET